MKVCIVGLGLLGGSFALAVRKVVKDCTVLGVDVNEEHARTALERGIAGEITTFEAGIAQADITVLATPVDILASQVVPALDLLKPGAILTDLGSTKEIICQKAAGHALRGRFVASHPIAGTEDSGPKAAFEGLLKDKMMIICDGEYSDADAVKTIEGLYEKVGMKIVYMPAKAHDSHIAFVSHLSHISSFALGATVLEKEKNEKNIFNMAGSGFSSTVRLAKSSPDMWAPIFSQNRGNISQALALYIEKLQQFKETIDADDQASAHRFMKETNDIRRVLKGDD
ncbi:MAG: prephenate dehydrogenase [Cyclobacteriaceae bacterium]|nr:prephenate dehydrogenase [Cyclobacteriaceae bacterium]